MTKTQSRTNYPKRVFTLLIILLSLTAAAYTAPWQGHGTESEPYLISTAADMNEIGAHPNDWDKHFILVNDVNLAKYSGEEFNIIGNTSTPFTGVFDGNGHTISNFTYKETLPWPILHPTLDHTDQKFNILTNINNMFSDDFIQDEPIVIPIPNDINWTPPDINWTPLPIPFPPSFGGDGLFASVDGVDAEIKNLTLVDPNIKTFGGSIGALVGHLYNGVISNCGVEGGIVHKMIGGTIIGFGNSHLGGLVGYISDGNVSDCYVSDCYLINQSWGGSASGLTARNAAGTISNCYAIDSVVTDGVLISGGLVTVNAGVILNSYTSGSEDDCGLVGTNLGTISNCYTTGSAKWAGLVGFNEGTISNCYATGTVAGNNFAGGLVSGNKGEISNCYATAAVDGNNIIGGLVGYNDGTISNCYATGPVTGDVNVGALVGYDDGGSYVSCFWNSDVNPDVNGIGNTTDPNVIGKPTDEMQTESTFTTAGWDFTTPVWKMCYEPNYPKLWWEECPELVEALLRIHPRKIKRNSKQRYILAFLQLPEGITRDHIADEKLLLYPGNIQVSDEKVILYPGGIEASRQLVLRRFIDDIERVIILALFDKAALTSVIPENGQTDLEVSGKLTTGQIFYGTASINIIDPKNRPRPNTRRQRRRR